MCNFVNPIRTIKTINNKIMKNNYLSKLLTFLFTISMTLTSCVEKVNLDTMDTNITLNPTIGLPIGSVHAYMTDLLGFVDSSLVNIDEKNGVYIFFEQDGLNIDFAVNQFSKGEKLNETLTLSRIEEVNNAFTTIDSYIIDFNNKIDEVNNILKTGKISYIEPLHSPESIILPNVVTTEIDKINTYINQINKFEGVDINSIPEAKKILDEIKNEIDKIGKLQPFTEIQLPEMEFTFEQHSEYNFGFNIVEEGVKNIRIDSAKVTSANIDFTMYIEGVDFTKGDYILVDLKFPKLFNDSIQDKFETFKITDNVFKFNEHMSSFMAYFDLINKTNFIDLSINYTFVSVGSLTINRNAKFTFDTEINCINFEEIYGHIWQKDEFQSGEFAFDIPAELFNSDLIKSNNILLSNPIIDVNFNHNVGIPMNLTIDNFYYEKDGERFNLNNEDQGNSIKLEIEQPSQIGEFSNKQFTLDNTNSPIADLIQKFPDRIGAQWHVLTPLTADTAMHYFINPLQANMDMAVTVPFQFDETTYFSYKDTIATDLTSVISDITDIAQIDTLCLYLDITSALPATVSAKLFFLDENFNLLRETNSFEITAAMVDNEGKVETPTIQSKTISFGNDLAQDITATKNIMFEIKIESYDDKSKIYIQSTDKIDIDLSVFAKAKIGLSLETNE